RKEQDKVEYLHRGLPVRPFTRRFELADHMTVTGASLNNGLLTIDLVREVPEEMKPRRITITREDGAPKAGQVEKPKQAA
ncbi:MAG: Hsp20 family protein, partial [Mesorhizobium sp.]